MERFITSVEPGRAFNHNHPTAGTTSPCLVPTHRPPATDPPRPRPRRPRCRGRRLVFETHGSEAMYFQGVEIRRFQHGGKPDVNLHRALLRRPPRPHHRPSICIAVPSSSGRTRPRVGGARARIREATGYPGESFSGRRAAHALLLLWMPRTCMSSGAGGAATRKAGPPDKVIR